MSHYSRAKHSVAAMECALISNGVPSSNIASHPYANLILATSSTAAPSAYAPSDTDPYDSGYEGDDKWEPDPTS